MEFFFENLLLGQNNELKNRYLHVDYISNRESAVKSANNTNSKCKNCTLEEFALLHAIAKNPFATQKELADIIGKSERTVKTRTVELQKKGYLQRKNGKRNGRWEIRISLSGEE